MKSCPACQHPLEISDASFCPFCGASLYGPAAASPAQPLTGPPPSPTPTFAPPAPTVASPPPSRTYMAPLPTGPAPPPQSPYPYPYPSPPQGAYGAPPGYAYKAPSPYVLAQPAQPYSNARATWATIGVVFFGLLVSELIIPGLTLAGTYWLSLALLRWLRALPVFGIIVGASLAWILLYMTFGNIFIHHKLLWTSRTILFGIIFFTVHIIGYLFALSFARWHIMRATSQIRFTFFTVIASLIYLLCPAVGFIALYDLNNRYISSYYVNFIVILFATIALILSIVAAVTTMRMLRRTIAVR